MADTSNTTKTLSEPTELHELRTQQKRECCDQPAG